LDHGISAYDACYVALAHRLGIDLITADQRLVCVFDGTAHAVRWLGDM
jgi:predicted nucleic acid-binding protein